MTCFKTSKQLISPLLSQVANVNAGFPWNLLFLNCVLWRIHTTAKAIAYCQLFVAVLWQTSAKKEQKMVILSRTFHKTWWILAVLVTFCFGTFVDCSLLKKFYLPNKAHPLNSKKLLQTCSSINSLTFFTCGLFFIKSIVSDSEVSENNLVTGWKNV